jgi:hypothetical protein
MKITKELFEKEIEMCRNHFQKKQSCAWGKCEDCGVPLLLQKLHKGEIIDNKKEIQDFKRSIFK